MQEADASGEKNWVLGVTAPASFMVALDTQVLTAALATLRADFGAPMEALQWTVNAFNLSFAVLLLTGAALGDRFGRRRLFAAGIALFMASSVACALSTSILALIAARASPSRASRSPQPYACRDRHCPVGSLMSGCRVSNMTRIRARAVSRLASARCASAASHLSATARRWRSARTRA